MALDLLVEVAEAVVDVDVELLEERSVLGEHVLEVDLHAVAEDDRVGHLRSRRRRRGKMRRRVEVGRDLNHGGLKEEEEVEEREEDDQEEEQGEEGEEETFIMVA